MMDPEGLQRRRFGRRRRRRSERRRQPRRAIFLLPNLITTAALMLGFWSMTRSFRGEYMVAAIAIVVAGVLDTMDGRIARATHSTSRFGVQYDSLADLVSFGIAPAILVYASALQELGGRGWTIAALFGVCAALRLARFNVQSEMGPRLHNYGLPSTTAGGMAAVAIWFCDDLGALSSPGASLVIALGTVALALLMVSGVPYPSWKNLPLSGRNAFTALVALVLMVIAVLMTGIAGFFAVGMAYTISGPLLWLWLRLARPDERERPETSQAAGEAARSATSPSDDPPKEPRPHVH